MTRTVLLLGAGYVGTALARSLAAAGDHVVAVRRRGASGDATPGVTWIAGDARDPARLAGLPPRADAVVLTAAPTAGRGDAYDATYPPLSRAALALARRLGAGVVAYTSSTGVYGRTDGAWTPEETPRLPRGPETAALAEAEDLLLAATDVRAAILRVAGIYGPSRAAMARFRDPARLAARGAYFTNFAHRDDIVAAIVRVLARPDAPAVCNCADGAALPALEVSRVVHELIGIPWPDPLVFDDAAAAAPPRSNQRVPVDRLRTLGWAPAYPSVREGFAALLADPDTGPSVAQR
ncbi:MAG: NAD-dependent epimerase/dehydratase family protein [Gemmatimonadota bacterium]